MHNIIDNFIQDTLTCCDVNYLEKLTQNKNHKWTLEAENRIHSNLTNKQKNNSNEVREICGNNRETSFQSKHILLKHNWSLIGLLLKTNQMLVFCN